MSIGCITQVASIPDAPPLTNGFTVVQTPTLFAFSSPIFLQKDPIEENRTTEERRRSKGREREGGREGNSRKQSKRHIKDSDYSVRPPQISVVGSRCYPPRCPWTSYYPKDTARIENQIHTRVLVPIIYIKRIMCVLYKNI